MNLPAETDPQAPVRKRIVFYLPGYDPIPARRYRELYRTQGALQSATSGYKLAVAGRTGGQGYGWTTNYSDASHQTSARIEFLEWNDIVQTSMQTNILWIYLQMFGALGFYIRTGALWRLVRLRPQPMLAALYPVFMLSAQLGLAAFIGRLFRQFFAAIPLMPFHLALIGGLLASITVIMLFRRNDGPIYAYYLALDYIFAAKNSGRLPGVLSERMARFTAQIRAAMQGDHDEVLIVGHSSGAQLAVTIAATLLRDAPATARLSLLTLGQVIPMVSFLPKAQQLRRALHDLAQDPRLTWVDVSAPGDGACFALSDPVSVSGVDPQGEGKLWPRVISAAFAETLAPETWRKYKWRFFRLHVQYLCAFDFPRGYDYFAITAGPQSLRQRFGDRGSTASRDARVLSPYTDI